MQIVIEIPDEVKEVFDKASKDDMYGCFYDYQSVIGKAIQNGTPFEPCSDAISRADVIDAIGSWLDSGEWRYTNATEYLKKRVKNLPPVNAEPHISCDGCEYEHYKEFNERCRYCCRGKNDKYYAEKQA